MERLAAHLNEGRPARTIEMTDQERQCLKHYHLLSVKPMMYIANVDESDFENHPMLDALAAHAATESTEVVPVWVLRGDVLHQVRDVIAHRMRQMRA